MFRKGVRILLDVIEKEWRQFYRLIRSMLQHLSFETHRKQNNNFAMIAPYNTGLYSSQNQTRRPLHIEEGVIHVRVTLSRCTVLNAHLGLQCCVEVHNFPGFKMNAAGLVKWEICRGLPLSMSDYITCVSLPLPNSAASSHMNILPAWQ